MCSLNNTHTSFIYNSFLIVTNFDKLSSLNFKSCSSHFNFTIFSLKPSTPLILNDSLDLDGLVIQPKKLVNFMIHNFKGFDFKSNPFKNVKFKSNTLIMWSIQYSNFDFYDNKNILIENKCNNQSLLLNNSFENQFNAYLIDTYETKFSKYMCPLIFWNIKLTILSIHRLSSTFIEKNQIGFQKLSNDLLLNEMNSKILHLQLFIYRSELDAKILDKYVFKQLKAIDLNGIITKIQDDLFKSFKNLNFIRFRIQKEN